MTTVGNNLKTLNGNERQHSIKRISVRSKANCLPDSSNITCLIYAAEAQTLPVKILIEFIYHSLRTFFISIKILSTQNEECNPPKLIGVYGSEYLKVNEINELGVTKAHRYEKQTNNVLETQCDEDYHWAQIHESKVLWKP